jgi:SP family general alpha glucoside:H+ symporter-like MFS transporter
MSHQPHSDDGIVVEDDKRDYPHAPEEGLAESKSWEQVKAEAVRDEEWQHSLTLWQSLKINRAVSRPWWSIQKHRLTQQAVLWSVAASGCIIMESYDTLLLGSLFGLPAFKEHFGNNYGGKAGYQIAPGWQAGMQQVSR